MEIKWNIGQWDIGQGYDIWLWITTNVWTLSSRVSLKVETDAEWIHATGKAFHFTSSWREQYVILLKQIHLLSVHSWTINLRILLFIFEKLKTEDWIATPTTDAQTRNTGEIQLCGIRPQGKFVLYAIACLAIQIDCVSISFGRPLASAVAWREERDEIIIVVWIQKCNKLSTGTQSKPKSWNARDEITPIRASLFHFFCFFVFIPTADCVLVRTWFRVYAWIVQRAVFTVHCSHSFRMYINIVMGFAISYSYVVFYSTYSV